MYINHRDAHQHTDAHWHTHTHTHTHTPLLTHTHTHTQTVPHGSLLASVIQACVSGRLTLVSATLPEPGLGMISPHTHTHTHTHTHCSIYRFTALLGLQWPEWAQPPSSETRSSTDRWADRHHWNVPRQTSSKLSENSLWMKWDLHAFISSDLFGKETETNIWFCPSWVINVTVGYFTQVHGYYQILLLKHARYCR